MLLKLPREIVSFILSIVVFEEFRCHQRHSTTDELMIHCLTKENMFLREYRSQAFAARLRYIGLVHPRLREYC